METTRPTLLGRLLDPGDHAAWREFDELYRDLLVRACRRFGLQPADAQDVRQIVMMNLAGSMPRFRYRPERGRFRDYLGVVVRNAIHRHLSRQNRGVVVLLEDADQLPSRDGDSAWTDAWNDEWRLHHYRTAMERLRAVFQPKSLEIFDGVLAGRTTDELAREFGTSTHAVYKVTQRIRRRLEELISQQLREEEHPDERVVRTRA